MLSYQHIYHAGSLADVHKHALLAAMLDYLTSKDKPLSYVETHAGRALYRLDAPEASKTGEAAAGIGRLEAAFPATHPYISRLAETRARFGASTYPGSPLIAGLCLRATDAIHLAELHPREHAALVEVMAPFGAHIRKEDGFAAALAICPPTPRRGIILIDPSYEVKGDYAAIPSFIAAIHRIWNVAVIALWYPILTGSAHRQMLEILRAAHPGALHHELAFGPARDGRRMVGSGMFVINPTYGLDREAARLSALFQKALPAA